MCPIGVEVMVGADGDSPFGAGIEPATFRFSGGLARAAELFAPVTQDTRPTIRRVGSARPTRRHRPGIGPSSTACVGSTLTRGWDGRGHRCRRWVMAVEEGLRRPLFTLLFTHSNQHAANHGVSLSASNRSVRLVVVQDFDKLAFLFGQQSGKRGFHDSRHRKNSRSVWPGPNGIDGHTLGYPAQ